MAASDHRDAAGPAPAGQSPKAVLVGGGELAHARAVALVLHGGRAESFAHVRAGQLAVSRMAPVALHLAHAGAPSGLAVWRLRFRYRGWNKPLAQPVDDVRWAVRHLRQRHGDVPIVLVGHSMGGRAAMRAADEPGVTAVLGLAPWLPEGEPREPIAGRQLLVVHGLSDRVTSPRLSKAFVDAVRPTVPGAAYIGLRGGGHAMLNRVGVWNSLTVDFVMYAAFGDGPTASIADAIARGSITI